MKKLSAIFGMICTVLAGSGWGAMVSSAPAGNVRRMIETRAWLEPEREVYPVNRSLCYVVEIEWSSAQGDLRVHVPETPELQNLQCMKRVEEHVEMPETRRTNATFRFVLQPIVQKSARIGSTYLRAQQGPAAAADNLTVAGRELFIGPPARDWAKISTVAGGSVVALGAAAGLLFWGVRRRKRIEAQPSAASVSPLATVREHCAELDRLMRDDGGAEYYGRLRDILIETLRETGAFITHVPTATEFSAWLEQQSAQGRETYGPCLALLEQIERVRFAGWKPTDDENRATRKELALIIDRLEKTISER